MRAASTSTPMTRQPLARSSWAVSWPEQAEADHHDRLTQRRLAAAHALQRDGTEGHGAGVIAGSAPSGTCTARLTGTSMNSA